MNGKPEQSVSSGARLPAAAKTVNSLVAAFKAFSFYPQEHVFTRRSLSRFHRDLNGFLAEFGELRLEIVKNSFRHGENVLLEGEPEENNPAYLLTRDGLIYLQFFPDIESRELSDLLSIMVRHRNPGEDDGDIVTALWQADFAHVRYEEVDIFTLEGFTFDLTDFQVNPDAALPGEEADVSGQVPAGSHPGQGQSAAPSGKSPAWQEENSPLNGQQSYAPMVQEMLQREQGMNLLQISVKEKKILADLIAEQEQKDFTSDIIDVLLIMLASQKNKVNFAQVLEFIRYQFFDTMERGAFHLAYKLLNNLCIIKAQLQGRPWAGTGLEDFFSTLAAGEDLSGLSWIKDSSSLGKYSRHLPFLWKVLRLLPPDSLMVLGPFAASIPVEMVHIRNELLAIAETMATADPDRLAALMAESDEDTALLLSPILARLTKDKAAEISLRMTSHPSPEIRKIGLDGYMLYAGIPDLDAIFPLLGDENPLTRERMISYLFAAGPEQMQSMLIRFLEQPAADTALDQRYIYTCYQALSRCGTADCLSFLEKVLLKTKFGSLFSNLNALHKKGAALTLKTLGTPEAMAILQKGRQSLRPDIRLACQHALGK